MPHLQGRFFPFCGRIHKPDIIQSGCPLWYYLSQHKPTQSIQALSLEAYTGVYILLHHRPASAGTGPDPPATMTPATALPRDNGLRHHPVPKVGITTLNSATGE